jgi:hypothetical protein
MEKEDFNLLAIRVTLVPSTAKKLLVMMPKGKTGDNKIE